MAAGETPALAVEVLEGPAASGKTTALINRIIQLLESGVALESILVVTASKDAAAAFPRRLGFNLPGGLDAARGLRSISARALSHDVLGQPEAVERVSHGPRMLLDVERSILIADLRGRGFDKDRLMKAQRDLYQLWDAGKLPGCDCNSDVRALAAMASDMGAYDVRELGARAFDCLDAIPQIRERLGADYVLVDDANFIGAAQLSLAERLARVSLVVAGDASVANPFFDAAATGTTLVSFARSHGIQPVRLEPSQKKVACEEPYVVKSVCPEDENEVVAKTVRHALDEVAVDLSQEFVVVPTGAEAPADIDPAVQAISIDRLVYPNEVAVVIPKGLWLKEVCQKLKAERVATVTCTEAQPVSGDPRHVATVATLQSFTLLGLSANPRDLMCWRTWVGLGRSDIAAAAWKSLVDFAGERGLAVVDALASLPADGDEPFDGAFHLARRYAQAKPLVQKVGRRRGRQALDIVSPNENLTFNRLCEPVVAQDAAELMDRANLNAVDRGFGGRLWDVRVGVPQAFAGLQTKACVMVGLNEGVAPQADRDSQPARYRNERLTNLGFFAKANRLLVLSYLQGCPAERSQKTGAKVRRVKRTPAGDVTMLGPSPLFRELGEEVPSTMSGQQFCSCVLKNI